MLLDRKVFELTNTKALQLFQLLRQGFLILVAILLANSHLSSQEVGYYEKLTYLGYLLTFFWVSGGIQALLALFSSLSDKEKSVLFFQSFLLFFILTLLIVCLAWSFREGLIPLLFTKETLPYLGLFCVFLLGNIPASLQEYFYLLQDRPKALLVFGGVSSLFQFLCFAVPLVMGNSLEMAIAALAVLGLLKWIWAALFVSKNGTVVFDHTLIKKWWTIAWPLIVYALIGAVSISIGPWFVGYFSEGDEAQFAIFRYGARELPLLTALAGALSSALIPILSANKIKGLADLKQKSLQLYHILFPASILLMITAQWWFVWVFGNKYIDSIPVFNTFLLTVIVHMVFARTVLIAFHDTKWIPYAAVLGLSFNIMACYFLGAIWGLVGIAMASIFAYFIEKGILTFFLWKRHGIKFSSYTNVFWWMFYTTILILVYISLNI